MSSRIKCGVSGANVLWEQIAGDFAPHYPKTLLATGWQEKKMLGRSLSCVRATCRAWSLHLLESGVGMACG